MQVDISLLARQHIRSLSSKSVEPANRAATSIQGLLQEGVDVESPTAADEVLRMSSALTALSSELRSIKSLVSSGQIDGSLQAGVGPSNDQGSPPAEGLAMGLDQEYSGEFSDNPLLRSDNAGPGGAMSRRGSEERFNTLPKASTKRKVDSSSMPVRGKRTRSEDQGEKARRPTIEDKTPILTRRMAAVAGQIPVSPCLSMERQDSSIGSSGDRGDGQRDARGGSLNTLSLASLVSSDSLEAPQMGRTQSMAHSAPPRASFASLSPHQSSLGSNSSRSRTSDGRADLLLQNWADVSDDEE